MLRKEAKMADIYEILEQVCEEESAEFSSVRRHRYSLKNRIRIRRIISQMEREHYAAALPRPRASRRYVTAALIVIMLAVMSITAAAVYLIGGFLSKEHSDNTQLFAYDVTNSPTFIEYTYYLSELPQEYVYTDGCLISNYMCAIYDDTVTGCKVTFEQTVKSVYNTHFDNEGYIMEAIEINGRDGIYLDYSREGITNTLIIWDNGDYILELESNMAKDKAIKLAESAKILQY